MFNKSIWSVFALQEVFAKLGQNMTPDEIIYWSRKGEELEAILKKGSIQFIQENNKSRRIAALVAAETRSIFKYKAPFNDHLGLNDSLALHSLYPATNEVEAFGLDLACSLEVPEAVRCIKKEYILNETLFTPQQIKFLAQEQFSKRIHGLLCFDRPNYFPMLDIKNQIIFVGIMWSDWKSVADIPKNKWNFFFHHKQGLLRENGNLILQREISE